MIQSFQALPYLAGTDGRGRPPLLVGGEMPAPGTGLSSWIVIVEDEMMIAWWMQTVIEEMGYERVDILASGEAALKAVASETPALMVMDINLGPGLDGVATAAAIRKTSAVPIIFVSAYADEATRARIGRDVPGAGLMRKPVAVEAFQRAVGVALEPTDKAN